MLARPISLTVHDVLEGVVASEEVSEHIEGVPEHKVGESVYRLSPLEASLELSLVSATSAATCPAILCGRVQSFPPVLVVSSTFFICDNEGGNF